MTGRSLRLGPVAVAAPWRPDTVLARVLDYRRRFGDYWQPAHLLSRLAAEGRGFHDSPQ
jgi:hypothetical protein